MSWLLQILLEWWRDGDVAAIPRVDFAIDVAQEI